MGSKQSPQRNVIGNAGKAHRFEEAAHVRAVHFEKLNFTTIDCHRVERPDVVLRDDLEHRLGHDPESVWQAGRDNNQVTVPAPAPFVSAADHDLTANQPQHLVRPGARASDPTSPSGSRPLTTISRFNPCAHPANTSEPA